MVCSMKKIVRGPFASVTGRRRALPPPFACLSNHCPGNHCLDNHCPGNHCLGKYAALQHGASDAARGSLWVTPNAVACRRLAAA